MITTLNKIRAHHPCKDGWEKLLRALNKTQPDDEPLLLEEILNSNGLGDTLWCLRAVEGRDREIRLYAVWCARQVQHLMSDPCSVAALDVAERYARGQASREELEAASAEWEAARSAAWEAAMESVRESVTCASTAAWEAAWAARPAASTAARSAAWAARSAAAREARSAAWEAARVAREMAAAKGRAAINAQVAEFRRVCQEIDAGRDPYPEETGR